MGGEEERIDRLVNEAHCTGVNTYIHGRRGAYCQTGLTLDGDHLVRDLLTKTLRNAPGFSQGIQGAMTA